MSSDQVTKGYFSYRSSTQTCVPYTRKFHLHEHHFFISWIWTPSSFHSHSNCSLHQFPLETKFDISKSEKELSIGSSTAPDINGRGRQAWGPEGWIYINGKISLNFWLPHRAAWDAAGPLSPSSGAHPASFWHWRQRLLRHPSLQISMAWKCYL